MKKAASYFGKKPKGLLFLYGRRFVWQQETWAAGLF